MRIPLSQLPLQLLKTPPLVSFEKQKQSTLFSKSNLTPNLAVMMHCFFSQRVKKAREQMEKNISSAAIKMESWLLTARLFKNMFSRAVSSISEPHNCNGRVLRIHLLVMGCN